MCKRACASGTIRRLLKDVQSFFWNFENSLDYIWKTKIMRNLFCVKSPVNLFKMLGVAILAKWISHQPTWFHFLPLVKCVHRESTRLPTGSCIHVHLPSNLQLVKEVLISWQEHLNREYWVGWGCGKVSGFALFTESGGKKERKLTLLSKMATSKPRQVVEL